eukprot:COSAG01_NODE_2677_length_7264_cov_2.780321_5_plen_41_part_00
MSKAITQLYAKSGGCSGPFAKCCSVPVRPSLLLPNCMGRE